MRAWSLHLAGAGSMLAGDFVHPRILGYRSRCDLDSENPKGPIPKGLLASRIIYAGLGKDRQSPAQPLATMPSEELGRLSGSSMCV